MDKTCLGRAVLALSLLVASPVFSIGSLGGAKIVNVRVDADGKGVVTFDQPIGGTPPACVSPYYQNSLAFGPGEGGRNILAFSLAAKATGATVTVYGTGTCAVYGVMEDWNYGVMD